MLSPDFLKLLVFLFAFLAFSVVLLFFLLILFVLEYTALRTAGPIGTLLVLIPGCVFLLLFGLSVVSVLLSSVHFICLLY